VVLEPERLDYAALLTMVDQLLGNIARYRGEYARACELFRRAREGHRALGNWFLEAIKLTQVADVLYEGGEFEAAAALAAENLAVFREHGPDPALSRYLETLALLAARQGDVAAARRLLEEGLAIERATPAIGWPSPASWRSSAGSWLPGSRDPLSAPRRRPRRFALRNDTHESAS
jgi:ATP/maltotriose-dependent transcriptional regulator MalT